MHRPTALLLVLLIAPCGAGSAADPVVEDLGTRRGGSDWPVFLGPRGDNSSPETGLLDTWPESGPPVVWTRGLGTGYGGPSVSKGRLFLFERRGDRARLTCLRSETGDELWRYEYRTDYEDYYGYNNGPRTTPVVDGDRVYIFGVEGELHCVRFGGEAVWRVDTTAKYNVVQNFFGVGSTPIVEGDLLIVLVGGSPPGSPTIHSGAVRGNGTGIVAFDKRSGKVVYEITDELASYASPMVTTIGGRRWGFVFARSGLVGFEPASGKVDFHFPWRARILESVNASNPVVVDDLVFISECYGPGSALLRVAPGRHEVVWKDPPGRRKAMQTHWNTAIHIDGHLYGSSGRNRSDAELRCVALRTGKVRWSRPGLTRSTLLHADGKLIVLTEAGELLLVRPTPDELDLISRVVPRDQRGVPLLRYPAWAPPVLSHGLLYVRGDDRLVCLELRSPAAAEPKSPATPTDGGSTDK